MPRITSATDHGGYFYVDYTVTQNIPGNYSSVSWVVGVHWGSYYWAIHNGNMAMSTTTTGANTSGSGSLGFSGYNSGWPISGAGTNRDYAFWAGTTRINHNSSGNGNIRFVGSAFWDTPANFTGSINSTVTLPVIPQLPGAPSTPVLTSVASTSVFVTFSDGSNGGAAIDSRQIGYGTSPSAPTTYISSDGSTSVTGLTPGTQYYFWARTHNTRGYGPLSGRSTATTTRIPDAPGTPTLSAVTPTSATVTWAAAGNGGSPITGYELGYGTSFTAPTTIISALSPKTVTGLTPGSTYYFWVRAINAVGTGPWSTPASTSTIAGVHVKVSGVWKFAVPWVKSGGVWKTAVPWVKSSGVWKNTQ